jgi:hypothetical protein
MNTDRAVHLNWLSETPSLPVGVTWGIPWPEGELRRGERFVLAGAGDEGEERIPVQTWPTAYWPDGSVKWTAHAASIGKPVPGPYRLGKGEAAVPEKPLTIIESNTGIEIDTGVMRCLLHRSGASIVQAVYHGDRLVCSGGKLVSVREERKEMPGKRIVQEEQGYGSIYRAVVEQRGPVRGVVRLEGQHQPADGGAASFPFVVRLYFYANQHSMKAVHTFLYDGDPNADFLKGIGMSFSVPMQGPLYNRYVRLAGDTGFFCESPKLLMTLRTTGKYKELYKQQTAGETITFDRGEDARFLWLLEESAVWDSFKLVQNSPDYYAVLKRTPGPCCWLKASEGGRAGGLAYAGSEGGGMAVGIRNFWRKYPSSLEIGGMSEEEASLHAWFWSPDAPAMDLRHYDTVPHVQSSYEGSEEMRSTPVGIGNTSELSVWFFERTPGLETLDALVREKESPPLLVCEPRYYHDAKAFGVWSLRDRSTPAKQWIEDQLGAAVQFYIDEVEQRRWYGFWDYGDVMHSYDPIRHTWRYDIGGCAWQNTELAVNMWLWYTFLRTGREDIFRMAEAMTRHTSEVDVYHAGEYAGLGSRHNVVHWGCGCKEARISMSGLHRFFYYLTADERIGDIMDEVKDADYALLQLDPMRAYFPKDEHPTHARVGPDWASFASNWFTRWERFEDTAYRDKLLVGIDCLKQMPFRMCELSTYGYDPQTGKLHYMGGPDNSGSHLAICMGEPQVWMELALSLQDPEWDAMLVELGQFYNVPAHEKAERTGGAISGRGYAWPMFSTGILAFAAARTGDDALAQQAWSLLLDSGIGRTGIADGIRSVTALDVARPIRENPQVGTNGVSQWGLNAIVCLELIGDHLPAEVSAPSGV